MALARTNFTTAYSARSTLDMRALPLWRQLCDTGWEAEARAGAQQIHIPKPDFSAITATAFDRTAADQDYKKGEEPTQALVTLEVGFSEEHSARLERTQDINTKLPYVERLRQDGAIKMALAQDAKLFTFFNGTDLTNQQGQTVTAPAYGSGQVLTITDGVSITAPYNLEGTPDIHPAMQAIVEFRLKLRRANAIAGSTGTAGRDPSPYFCVMAPEMFESLENKLLSGGYGFDRITDGVLQRGTVYGDGEYRERLRGVDIYTSNSIAVPATADADWPMILGGRSAVALAARDVFTSYISPTENQSRPYHELHSISDWGVVLLDDSLLYKASIDAVA